MSNILLKLFPFKYLAVGVLFFVTYFAQGETTLSQGDSLFNAGNYAEALRIYKQIHEGDKLFSRAMLLKMAYIEENLGNYTYALYYLSLYDLANPSNETLRKTDELAKKHVISGYEYTDVSFFSVLFRKYRDRITIVLFLFFVLTSIVIIRKRLKMKHINIFEKIGFFTFAVLLVFLNTPTLLSQKGIVAKPYSLLMSGPSAGSEVTGTAEQGTSFDISGKEDIWYKIKTSGKTVYIRRENLLIVE